MPYKAIVFDLDGTLLDSLDDLADSMNAVLSELGAPTHSPDKYCYFVGNGVEKLVRRALPEDASEETFEKAVAAMRSEYHKRWDNKTRPYDGIPQLLDELTRRGVEMAILSNKPHDFTVKVVEKLLADWKFKFVWGVSDTVPAKPDPKGINRLVEELAIPANELLYMGDTNTDMETANAAGIYSLGALWGFRSADELTAAGASRLLHTPTEALELLM